MRSNEEIPAFKRGEKCIQTRRKVRAAFKGWDVQRPFPPQKMSTNASATKAKEELSRYECKQLLQDVERSTVPRAVFSFASLCNDNQPFYGRSGEPRRRAFQYKWNNFRRRTIDGYSKALKYYGVQAGPHSLKEAEEAANYSDGSQNNDDQEDEDDPILTHDPVPTDPANDPAKDPAKDGDTAKDYDSAKDDEEEEAFKDIMMPSSSPKEEETVSISSPPRAPRATPSPSPFRTPPRATGFRSPVLSPPPSNPMTSLESALSGMSLSGSGDGVDFPGSKYNPFLSPVDLDFPERSRDFNTHIIEGLERGDYAWKAAHIRTTVPTPDRNLWSAVIPDPSTIATEYVGRVILIKAPSLDFYERNHDIYHHKLKCEQTKKAHRSADAEMKANKDDERHSKYYLLIFPEGTELDNSHLGSSGSNTVPKYSNAITFERKHVFNKYGKDILGTAVYWEIAFKNGGKPIGNVTDDADKDESTFFD
jgi:hypothetical protein